MTDNYSRYLLTYSGRTLIKQHGLNTTGFWLIKGEDPNCDMGGAHYKPDLGMVEGKLEDVINYAVAMPDFWSWGVGGTIMLSSAPKKITRDSGKERKQLLAQQISLKAALRLVENALEQKA